MEPLDWDEELQKHLEKLENEYLESQEKLEMNDRNKNAWALWEECKTMLEDNEESWIRKKTERKLEIERKERLSVARSKQTSLKEKILERKLENEVLFSTPLLFVYEQWI